MQVFRKINNVKVMLKSGDAKKRLLKIRMLMLLSYLLLVGFVFYWLHARYSEERVRLHKEIARSFNEAEQSMMDSIIIKRMVDPVISKGKNKHLLDSIFSSKTVTVKKSSEVTLNKRPDSLPSRVSIEIVGKNNSDMTFSYSDSIVGSKTLQKNLDEASNDVSDFLAKSIKFFVNQINVDSSGTHLISFRSSLDTAVFQTRFADAVASYGVLPVWSSRDSSLNMDGDFRFNSLLLNNEYGVDVIGVERAIYIELLPNIVFVLLLLLLTGTSFIVSLLAYKKQLLLNEMRSEFVSNVSHELKTPVATIKVVIESLRGFVSKGNIPKTEEYLGIATHEVERLETLIHKVLQSSATVDKNKMLNLEAFNVKNLVDDVVDSLCARAEQCGAELSVACSLSNPMLNADRLHVRGVLLNLLDNSLKYNLGKPVINVAIDGTERELTISVSDNGIGIPSEYLPRVFDKFFRVPTNNVHNTKGYGLGLNYASMVMAHHKGTIAVKNNPSGGCTFTLKFPL